MKFTLFHHHPLAVFTLYTAHFVPLAIIILFLYYGISTVYDCQILICFSCWTFLVSVNPLVIEDLVNQ